MRRIVNRRYGRDGSDVKSSGATHKISIGKKNSNLPDKLSGFVILRETLDENNKPMVDFDAMATLGYDKQTTLSGIAAGFKGIDVLPQMLRFVLISDAVRDGDGWSYPSIHAEAYECYAKEGRICTGDGHVAQRKMPDGSKREVACIPFGSASVSPKDYCPFSQKKECKSHSRITVLLYVQTPSGPKPLVPSMGMSARFRFDTTSEYHSMEVLGELDRVSERVNGNLNGLTGTLTFQKKHRRTGTGSSVVGHVFFQIDPEAVLKREQQLREADQQDWNRRLEFARANLQLPAPSTQPAAPTADLETVESALPEEPLVVEDPEPAPPMDLEQDDNELELLVQKVEKAAQEYVEDFGETYVDALNTVLYECKDGFKNRKGEVKQTQTLAELTDGVDREKAIKFFSKVVARLEANVAVDAEFVAVEVAK